MVSNSNKIKKRSEYQEILKSGKRWKATTWLMLGYKRNSLGTLRFGTTVSSKVGNAVLRNKLKRWCREYFNHKPQVFFNQEVDINVIYRPMPPDFYKKLSYSEFEIALDKFFKNLK